MFIAGSSVIVIPCQSVAQLEDDPREYPRDIPQIKVGEVLIKS